jgi:DNA-binding LytR/AlgR family response regulator
MIKVAIIDDEPLGLDLIIFHLRRFKQFEIARTFTNSVEAKDWLRINKVDVIFTDIEMPVNKGFALLDGVNSKSLVVFISAFRKYALEAYEYNVIDYIVKPISQEKFNTTIDKIKIYFSSVNDNKKHTFINSEYQQIKIEHHEVLYIEGLKDYVKIHIEGGARPILTRQNLKRIEELLSDQIFRRVHKSFIINIEKVTKVDRDYVYISGKKVPISPIYKKTFIEILGE